MLGIALTMMDGPLVIDNAGLFVFTVSLYCLILALGIALCLIQVRDGLETIVAIESYNRFYHQQAEPEVQSRFQDIVNRVQRSLINVADDQVVTLGFPSV